METKRIVGRGEELAYETQPRDVLFGELFSQCEAISKSLAGLEDVIRPCLREADPVPPLNELCKDPEVRSEIAKFGTQMGMRLDGILAHIANVCERVQW